MAKLPSRMPRGWWLIIPLLAILYFYNLSAAGMLGPDEPRYASIGREMAHSGDWVTPRLWGEPWFEKPALLYWMTGTAFRLGFGDDLAPRVLVAFCSVGFLIFFLWIACREFGAAIGGAATLMLATAAAWVGYSFIGVTDLPMAAAFSAAMLLCLDWIANGDRRRLPVAAAMLGVAVLAKGLVPLILALPLVWCGRRRFWDLVRPPVVAAFLVVAAPWYMLCYLRNGAIFPRTFFWEHHFQRFTTGLLLHGQPFWFYAPVLLVSLLPWTPLLVLLGRRALHKDARLRFLLLLVVFGLIFFSASKNKLPGYLLPLLPAMAVLMSAGLAEEPRARWALPAAAVCLAAIAPAIAMLPQALAEGITRTALPAFQWAWLAPVALAVVIYWMERREWREAAMATMAAAVMIGVLAIKTVGLPAIDRAASARPVWREVAGAGDRACVDGLQRSWRYGLNYYSVVPLPDCSQVPRPLHVRQMPGQGPAVATAGP